MNIENIDWRYHIPVMINKPIKKYKLMLKQHWDTGVSYLCITGRKDWESYTGSGTRWKLLLNKQPSHIKTTLIYTSNNKDDFDSMCSLWSAYLDVKNSLDYANLIPETGYQKRYQLPIEHNKERAITVGKITGAKLVENKLGIHNPKYNNLRSTWASNASKCQKLNNKQGGFASKEWRDGNKLLISNNASMAGKIGGAIVGNMLWWNNGIINKKSNECPGEGYVRGMLMSEKKRLQVYNQFIYKKEKMTNKLLQKILSNSPTKYAAILSESDSFNKKDSIPTEIPIINIAFSGEIAGGMNSGLTLLAGPTKTFKSSIALVCAKAYLNKYKDSVVVLYDSEGGMSPEYLFSQGVDPSRVVHIPIEHLEMLKFDIVKQLKELNRGDKVLFIIDSIGNTASLKELQDALDERTVAEMQRAKVIKSLFRMVTPSLVNKDIPCIAICHTYETMEMYSRQVISGGTGLIYSANQAFIIGKSQEKSGTDLVGWNFTLNVEKSRTVREKSKLVFRVLYESGIQKYSGLLELGIESGLIVKPSMGWYSRKNKDGVIEEKKWRAKDTDSPAFWDDVLKNVAFDEFISNKYKLVNLESSDKQIDEEIEEILENDVEE